MISFNRMTKIKLKNITKAVHTKPQENTSTYFISKNIGAVSNPEI